MILEMSNGGAVVNHVIIIFILFLCSHACLFNMIVLFATRPDHRQECHPMDCLLLAHEKSGI